MSDPLLTTLELYRQEIAKTPLLTRKEELQFVRQIEQREMAIERLKQEPNLDSQTKHELEVMVKKGQTARNRLTSSNLRLVYTVAKRYSEPQSQPPLADLIQAGNEALMHIAQKYRSDSDYRFGSYAWPRLRQAMIRAKNQDRRQAGYAPAGRA